MKDIYCSLLVFFLFKLLLFCVSVMLFENKIYALKNKLAQRKKQESALLL